MKNLTAHFFGVEQELKKASQEMGMGYFERYLVLKNRFLSIEYQHTSRAGDNSSQHVLRILEKLDALVGSTPISTGILNVYELFLAMVSVLYHDLGRLRDTDSHPSTSSELVHLEQNPYLITDEDKDSISLIVSCHGGDKEAWVCLQPVVSHSMSVAMMLIFCLLQHL